MNTTGKRAFSASTKANFTCSPSRRRPPLFLGNPAASSARELPHAAVSARRVHPRQPASPVVAAASACFTQSRSAEPARSRSLATWPADFPPARTNSTACALYSAVNDLRTLLLLLEIPVSYSPVGCVRVSTKPYQSQFTPGHTRSHQVTPSVLQVCGVPGPRCPRRRPDGRQDERHLVAPRMLCDGTEGAKAPP